MRVKNRIREDQMELKFTMDLLCIDYYIIFSPLIFAKAYWDNYHKFYFYIWWGQETGILERLFNLPKISQELSNQYVEETRKNQDTSVSKTWPYSLHK